jgi:phage shock protein A
MTGEHLELERLTQRFPVARGRFAKDALQRTLAEIAQTSRLIEANPKKSRKPQEATKIYRDMIDHQRTLTRQVEALLLHGMEVDADIAMVAGHLRRTQYVAAHGEDLASRAHEAVAQVSDALADLADFVGDMQSRLHHRIDDLEGRLTRLEARMSRMEAELAANQALDRIVSRWRSHRTYDGLPWAYAVTLLAYEVFAGPVGSYEFISGDSYHREKLAAEVLAAGAPWSERRPPGDIVTESAGELGSGELAVWVGQWLGTGLPLELDGSRGELVAALRDRIRGADVAELDGPRLTGEGFLDQVVHEQAETVLEQRKNAWPPDLGAFVRAG